MLIDEVLPDRQALRPRPRASSMSSRYGAQALAFQRLQAGLEAAAA